MKNFNKWIYVLFFGMVITACNQTIEDYPLSNLRAISGFAIDYYHNSDCNICIRHEGVIDELNRTITLNLPTDVDLTHLRPTILLSPWSTVSPSTLEPVDFSAGQVDYTVTAQSGKTTVYTVSVTNDYIYSGADIWQFYILDLLDEYGDPVHASPSSYSDGALIKFVLPDDTDKTKLHIHLDLSASSHRAKVEVCESVDGITYRKFTDGEVINFQNDPVIFRVTSESGKEVRYMVSIIHEKDVL